MYRLRSHNGTWQGTADRLRIDAASGEELVAAIVSTSVCAHSMPPEQRRRGRRAAEPDGAEALGQL